MEKAWAHVDCGVLKIGRFTLCRKRLLINFIQLKCLIFFGIGTLYNELSYICKSCRYRYLGNINETNKHRI